jgi:hypothetical protein
MFLAQLLLIAPPLECVDGKHPWIYYLLFIQNYIHILQILPDILVIYWSPQIHYWIIPGDHRNNCAIYLVMPAVELLDSIASWICQ